MEDSFFGFNTSAPTEDDGTIAELSEEDYDALNDETFGSAVNGDWEEDHENLVRCLDGINGNKEFKNESNDEDENSDLGINLSRVKFDDVEICSDDNESRYQLDLSVWSNPVKPETKNDSQNSLYSNNTEPEFLRRNFSNSLEALQAHFQHQSRLFSGMPSPVVSRKICTVEDIERNIRNQQQQQQQQHQQMIQHPKTKGPNISQQHQQQQQQQQQSHSQNTQMTNSPNQSLPPQQLQLPPPPQLPQPNFFNRPGINPPNFSSPRVNFPGPQHQMNLHVGAQPPPHRLPPGFSGLPFPPVHNLGVASASHHPNFPRPLTHNLPIALNNFAMHPNFNAMRPIGPPIPPPRLPQHPVMVTNALPTVINQFNQRLMQEIQQNHPMLANCRPPHTGMHNLNSSHNPNQNYQPKQNMKQNPRSNGNVEEYDEYANLMSTRDKHWLIAIQLSQLNTDTPYLDDYYYTVFKERRAKLNGENLSKTHKDNQRNHPLTQPKGHAQLVLVSLGKNGTNSRNNQNRERKNSDTKNDKDQSQRVFTPLQFENSLGKLQYGSVTAPRKIIDMEIMGNDSGNQFTSTVELSTQRKSRQLLLHIETLYRILLKLEDLQNPAAIATSLILKEKREKDKQLLQEQPSATETDDLNKSDIAKRVSADNSVGSSLSDSSYFELESRDKLLQKLIPCLSIDKIIGMMNVRKGKTLIRRILSQIDDNPIRWNVWLGVFTSLSTVLKKDKHDNEGLLYAIYPEFKRQISSADLENVVEVAKAMPLNDKKLNNLFASKFCISSLVAILLRAEELYSTQTEVDPEINLSWTKFLSALSSSLSRSAQQQTISAAIESDAVRPMINHFSRFKNLELDPLLAFFSQGKVQVA